MSDVFATVVAGGQVTFPTVVDALDRMVGCAQTPAFHGEGDVATHTAMVVDQANQLLAERPDLHRLHDGQGATVLRLAALLHDVGKPSTSRPVPNKPGWWTAPRHAEEGAKLTSTLFASHPTLLALPNEVRWAVHTAVRNHMWSYHPFTVTDGQVLRSAHLLDPRLLDALWTCDHQGRICDDHGQLSEQRELAWLRLTESYGPSRQPWPFLDMLNISPDELSGHQRQQLLHGAVRGDVTDAGHAYALLEASGRGPSSRLVWTFGLPGAGKSTWAARRAAELDATLVTTAGVARRRDRRKVHGHGRQQLKEALSAGRDVVVDATHVRRSSRDRVLQLAANYNVTVEAATFDINVPLALERQQTRPAADAVPTNTIWQMAADARWPTPDEYAHLTVVTP